MRKVSSKIVTGVADTNSMDDKQVITWFAGLFEGEGSFRFLKEKPKAMAISMTDKDVLDKVQELFGGKLYSLSKRKDHWKNSWVWVLTGPESVQLATKIMPFLFSRRKQRCQEYIEAYKNVKPRSKKGEISPQKKVLIEQVTSLRLEGLTHKAIADRIGIDRSYVSHILRPVV